MTCWPADGPTDKQQTNKNSPRRITFIKPEESHKSNLFQHEVVQSTKTTQRNNVLMTLYKMYDSLWLTDPPQSSEEYSLVRDKHLHHGQKNLAKVFFRGQFLGDGYIHGRNVSLINFPWEVMRLVWFIWRFLSFLTVQCILRRYIMDLNKK